MYSVFSTGSFCQIYRVTDEAFIAETVVWPNFFIMNVFFALKGSKHFIIIWTAISFISETAFEDCTCSFSPFDVIGYHLS